MKKKHRFLSVSLYDLAGVESWLEEQERKGWRLYSFRGMANFEKTEPRAVSYRLAPQPKGVGALEEQKELYGAFGWEYVCTTGKNWFSVWRSDETEPRELHTDPQVEGELLDKIYHQQKGLMFLSVVLILLALGMAGVAFFGHPQPLLYWAEYGQSVLIIGQLVNLLLVGQLLRDYLAASRLVRAMQAGQPRPHKRRLSWKDRYYQYVLLGIACLGLVLCLFELSWQLGVERVNLEDYQGSLPAVRLAEIEETAGLRPQEASVLYKGIDWNNFVSLERSELCRVMLEYSENATLPGRMWADGSGEYSPSLTVNYYGLRLSFLAKPLLKELLEDKMENTYYLSEGLTVRQLWDAPFDEAYLLEDAEMKFLLARLGDSVIQIRYFGYGDLEKHFEDIAREMEGF